MSDRLVRALLGVGGMGVVALLVSLVAAPEWGYALCSVALLCLFVHRARSLGPGQERRPHWVKGSVAGRAGRCRHALTRLGRDPRATPSQEGTQPVTPAAGLDSLRRDGIANGLHELCTPVTVLAGYLDALRELELDASQSRDYLDSMEEQCRRVQGMIKDLLKLSKLEAAPEPPDAERVEMGALLAKTRAEAEALSAGRHRIVLEVAPGLDLLGARNEFASAFSNLASNAVRYTPAGGEIRLLWRAAPTGAEFTVADSGIGIAKEHIPRLTERFYRVDCEFSRHIGGTGLGLAIVKDVLARHQATLEIESEPGKGSRFTARFPAQRVLAATTARYETYAALQQPASKIAFARVQGA